MKMGRKGRRRKEKLQKGWRGMGGRNRKEGNEERKGGREIERKKLERER